MDGSRDAILSAMDADRPRNSSNNTDSKRVVVTKRIVFEALYSLMAECDFQDITVGDILRRSGVSRSTFYRCFRDKYDVVNWSFKRFKEINPQFEGEYYSFSTSLHVQLEYLAAHKEYFSKALRYLGQNSLRDCMYETNLEYILECWNEAHLSSSPDRRTLLAARFTAAGMAKTVECWVLDGCDDGIDAVVAAVIEVIPAEFIQVLY